MEEEVWKSVPSAPFLEASSFGRIMVEKWRREKERARGGHAWTGAWDGKRYIFRLRGKTYKVARVVCEAFHGPAPDDRPLCLHLDENSRNNRPENLRWGTQAENLSAPRFIEAKRFAAMVLSDEDVRAIRARADERRVDLAAEFGVAPCTISNIISGRMRKNA